MADADPDPSDLAAAASGDDPAGGIPGPDNPTGEVPDMGEPGDTSIVDMLLSTEPDESVQEYEELHPAAAHAIIGIKKMVNEATDANLSRGTPAIENFGRATISAWTATGTDSNDEPDGRAGEW